MTKANKIKVAMVSHDFPLQEGVLDGGVTAAVYYLSAALQETGDIELDIIRPLAPNEYNGQLSVAGLRVHALNVPAGQSGGLHSQWSVRNVVREKLQELGPEVIHVQGHAVIAAGLPPEKTVLTVHGILEKDILFRGRGRWVKSKLLGITQRYAYNRVRNIISISPYIRQQVTTHADHRVWDIANPVAPQYFDVQRAPRKGVIFSAAMICERKNVQGLIRAFAGVAKQLPHAELRLAGAVGRDLEYVEECRRLAASFRIEERVKFLGILNVPQMLQELAQADCFALCSFQESAPVSIGEAMAAGVPVLASAVGGVSNLVQEGVTGRLIKPEDTAGITQALLQLLNKDDLSTMATAARTKAVAEYHSSAVAHKTIQVYKALLTCKTL